MTRLGIIQRRTSLVSAFAVIVAMLALGTGVGSAQAVPNRVNEKVTICHRTHATTNPYRQITVSMSSIIGNGNSGNGHGGVNHNPHYTGKPVFDPTFTYPANQKQWQDIIPPFNYVPANGNPGSFAGLNWDAVGQAIYYGYTLNGVDYSGLCGKMSARDFYELETAAGRADNPNANNGALNQIDNDAMQDVKDQNAEEDGNITSANSLNDLPDPAQRPRGAKVPDRVRQLQEELDTTNNGQVTLTQAIAGVVWYDDDEDGEQDLSENMVESVEISLLDPTTGTAYTRSRAARSLFNFQNTATYTVTTDANGYFMMPDIPEGEWTVIVTTPDGYTYTYDSNGTADGQMPGTYVPAGGVGFASAGIVQDGSDSGSGSGGSGSGSGSGGSGSSGSESGGSGSLSSTDTEVLAETGAAGALSWGIAAALLMITGAGMTIARRRTR